MTASLVDSSIRGVDQASALRRLAVGSPLQRASALATPTTTRIAPAPARSAFTITVASGKGGVGKTTISINLCVELVRLGFRVILLDADYGMANADVMCGLSPRKRLENFVGSPASSIRDLIVRAPGGFDLVPGMVGIAGLMAGQEQQADRLAFGLAVLEESYDAVVVDAAAGAGWHVLSMLKSADLGLIVTTPEPPAMTDAYALLKCTLNGCPSSSGDSWSSGSECGRRLGFVVNQAGDETEAERTYERISRVAAAFLGQAVPSMGSVLRDPAVSHAIRQCVPVSVLSPDARASRGIRGLAARLREWIIREDDDLDNRQDAPRRARTRWWDALWFGRRGTT